MSIALVVGTYNRAPGPNYLAGLLGSLRRSGVWDCGLLHGEPPFVHIVDGGSATLEHLEDIRGPGERIAVHYGLHGQHANETFWHMARVGVETGAPWVITCEDDTVVCADFLGRVAAWAREYATPDYPMFPLYCPYQDVVWAHERGERSYRYIISSYYGTQACLWRAENLALYLRWYEVKGNGQPCFWDLLIAAWAQETWPQQPYFLTPVGSFVQHVGVHSALGLNDRFHTAPCFAGEA